MEYKVSFFSSALVGSNPVFIDGRLKGGYAVSLSSLRRFLSVIKTLPREFEHYTMGDAARISNHWFGWIIERPAEKASK